MKNLKINRKLISLITAGAISLSLAGCSPKDNDNKDNTNSTIYQLYEGKLENNIDDNVVTDNNIEVKAKNTTENLTTNDNKEVVLNNVNNALNTYVTYHIHVLSDGEDINTIINKYKVNKELIDEYNSNLEWVMGEKVIIPELQDE